MSIKAGLKKPGNLLAVVCLLLLALLPLRAAQALGSALGRLFYRVGRKRLQVSRRNLEICYPQLSQAERETLVRGNAIETGKLFAEFGLSWLWPWKRVDRLIRVQDESLMQAAYAEGRGVLLVIPHLGNWELVNTWIAPRYPFAAMYRPSPSAWLEHFVHRRRSRQGTFMAPATSFGVRQIMKKLKAGYVTAVLADHLPSRQAGVVAPFFGHPALTGKLAAKLAALKPVVLTATVIRLPKARGFELVFQRAEGLDQADAVAAATALNQAIERCVALAPAQYQWTYKRFGKLPEVADVYRKAA